MNTELQQMGERIKGLRSILNISESEMAKVTGTAVSEYKDYENGKKDMSFTFLFKCANRFGIDISELVTGDMPKLSKYSVTRNNQGMPIKRREGFDYQHLAALFKNRISEPFVVTAKYDKKAESLPVPLSTHNGQELDYVLSGSLKVQIEEHTEVLNKGDSIYYDANKKHGMIALNGDCVFLAVVSRGDESGGERRAESGELAEKHTKGELLYKQYVNETVDSNGMLTDITFNVPANFNFAYDVVDKLAALKPDKTAMVWLSEKKEKRVFSFKDMSDYSSKTANYLVSLGIKKGDKVMIILKRHYEFWFFINALHKIGAAVIPATLLLTTKDLVYRFDAAGVSAVVSTSDGHVSQFIDEAQKEKGSTLKTKVIVRGKRDGWHCFDEDIEKFSPKFERVNTKTTDRMIMYFTSGTTGYPKIVEHDYSYPLGHITTARWWQNVDPNGLHFTISDTGWAKSVWGKLYGQWLCETAVFTYDFDKFSATDILPLFKEHGITTFCAPPTMYRFFIKEDLKQYDIASALKYAVIAGEALNPEVYEQFYENTGLKLMEGFGQTELTLAVANLIGMQPKPGSMGKPNPQYDVDLINHEGKTTAVGEVGEIVLHTDKKQPCGMFKGYYRNEEKTKEVWYDNMYHTGDMAWRDEDGYYWFVGRTDDLIKSSGYRIGPFEVESVIMELPYVLECAVTGEPDEIRGQVIKATIVLTKNAVASESLKKEIQDYVKTHTAPYKYPKIIEFVDALPKTISGKIKRIDIRGK